MLRKPPSRNICACLMRYLTRHVKGDGFAGREQHPIDEGEAFFQTHRPVRGTRMRMRISTKISRDAMRAGCVPTAWQDVVEQNSAQNILVPLLTRYQALRMKRPLIGLQGDDKQEKSGRPGSNRRQLAWKAGTAINWLLRPFYSI